MSLPIWSAAQLDALHIAAVVSLSVFLLLFLAARSLQTWGAVRRRAMNMSPPFGPTGDGGLHASGGDRAARLMARLESLLAPSQGETLTQIRRQLVQAGFFSAPAVAAFYGSRILLAVILPVTLLASTGVLPIEIPGALVLVLTACLALLGLVLPSIALDFRIRYIREKYRRVFPDFMDLLVVCIESGQSLPSALDRVGREIIGLCPELGANLHLLNLELRAGSTVAGGLSSLHARIGIDEVQSLAVLLKQSEELGVSIADTLRVYADEMRDKRLSRAEARANALPVKMTIPLGLFIFPVILLVILTPVVIRIKNAFV
jgi:tight adherence protein C